MGGAGEKPQAQEDTVYYNKKRLFELNILVCGNYIEDLIRKDLKKDFFLAGGLNTDNISLAIKDVNPFAVDLSSSLETDGYKDEIKIKKLMEAIND